MRTQRPDHRARRPVSGPAEADEGSVLEPRPGPALPAATSTSGTPSQLAPGCALHHQTPSSPLLSVPVSDGLEIDWP